MTNHTPSSRSDTGNYVVVCCLFYSQVRVQLNDLKNLTSRKIISVTTPVICAIIYLTVSSVKLLNNVVCGTGNYYG